MSIVLVTGATRGVGRETARRLVLDGHDVLLGARDPARGQHVAREIGAEPLSLDVTDADSIAAAVATVTARGGLDVLVNNAGIGGEQRPPGEADMADLRAVFETNVFGATAVLNGFTPLLDASHAPVVVNVSSRVGSLERDAQPDSRWKLVAYPMSKAALNMLTIQWAHAFPRWRVNSATPGFTRTDFTANQAGGHSVEEGAEILVRMAEIGPDGPTCQFVDIDGVIAW